MDFYRIIITNVDEIFDITHRRIKTAESFLLCGFGSSFLKNIYRGFAALVQCGIP